MDDNVVLICKSKLMLLNTTLKTGEKLFNIFVIIQYGCP